MLCFPNCKINLGLRILGKRTDGYHNLETVFFPINFTDALEIIPNKQHTGIEFTVTGLTVDGTPEDNLCVKAWQLLKKDLPHLAPVKIHLHKVIPMGAGLGGGSADAAYMLRLLNEKFNLLLSNQQLMSYALQLGSDCPFFIINKPCFATGRGEVLEEIALDLSKYKIVIINPRIHVNTGWAFAELAKGSDGSKPAAPSPSDPSLKYIIQQPIETWKDVLKNDFEKPVSKAHPQIREIKEYLYGQGAIYAAMSGSGSTVFGIFDKNIATITAPDPNYFMKIIN